MEGSELITMAPIGLYAAEGPGNLFGVYILKETDVEEHGSMAILS